MKILQLCNKIPYPPNDGGAIATYNLSLALAHSGHEVRILAMNTPKHYFNSEEIPADLRKLIHFDYIRVDTRINVFRALINLLLSAKPYNAVRFFKKSFARKLREILLQGSFDIVQLEGLYLKPYIPLIRKYSVASIIYRAHNVESDIWKGLLDGQRNLLKKKYLNLLVRRLVRYEKEFMDQYDFLLPISTLDATRLTELGNTKPMHVTYTGIPDQDFVAPVKKNTPDLFFVGALDWMPNQDGLCWFLEKIWEKLKKEQPTLRFYIAGRNAPAWFVEKLKHYGTHFHGEIADAHQFMDEHDIMLVPLFTGSGLRIKIVEAMSRSVPVITTPAGARGLPEENLKGIVISGDSMEWISHIKKLMSDEKYFSTLQQEAFHYAKQNFSEKSIMANLLYFYTQQGLC